MKILGLDLGSKRIGVAVSDEMGWTAQVHSTIQHTSRAADVAAVSALCQTLGAERVVVGLPLNMDGTKGAKAREAEKFAEQLRQEIQLPVELWDERLTTVSAQRILLEADLSRQKRRAVVDRLAAAHILQGWLDGRSSANKKI